jgi:hypothetical protein
MPYIFDLLVGVSNEWCSPHLKKIKHVYIYSEVGMIQGWVYFHLLDPFGSNIPMMFGLVVPAMAANESCQC